MVQENIQRYHPLGNRTLFMLIFEKSGTFFAFLLLLIIGVVLLNFLPSQYVETAINLLLMMLALVLLLGLATFGIGWLQYYRYWIFVDDKDLKIARGLIATEQIGIPYRHIQDAKIERSLVDQLFGVSDIIITTLDVGESGESPQAAKTQDTIILPALSKEIALQIQDIVLKKAQVEQINILGGQNKLANP